MLYMPYFWRDLMFDPLISLLIGLLVIGFVGLVFWPSGGFFDRWQRASKLSARVRSEDALKHIQKAAIKNQVTTLESIAGTLQISLNQAAALVADMEKRELVTSLGGMLELTPKGQDYALHIIRAHRLWERYLAEETGFAEGEWHALAEQFEHNLTPEEISELSARLGHPTHDPHGDPIPTEAGEVVPHGGQPLTALTVNQDARIVHLEDEPEAVSAQLVAEGLYLGMHVHLLESSPQRVRFWANGDEHLLAPIVAANISVIPVKQEVSPEKPTGLPLSQLKPGQSSEVTSISPRCRGPERRRLMDLGILPGTKISAEMTSPTGDPTAYLVRDTLIALRAEQAHLIYIRPLSEIT
jgi:DtxR family Mn-dependent transcriptional regulator